MVATTSTKEFYSGDQLSYSLKAVVAQAGGNVNHFNLFNFLLSPSLTGTLKNSKSLKKIQLHDCREGGSLLLLFPLKLQLALSILLHLRELDIYTNFSNVYNITNTIKNPRDIIELHRSITNLPLGSFFISILSQNQFTDNQELKVILGDTYPNKLFTDELLFNEKLDLLFDYFKYQSPFLDNYKSITNTNNRCKAIVFLAEYLNYSIPNIQSLVNITELWLMQTSST